MKIVKLIAFIFCFQFSSLAQEVLLKIPVSGKKVIDFIPAKYKMKDSVNGDLNKDGIKDLVLVLHHQDEDTFQMDEEPKRLLLVLFRNKAGFSLAGKSTGVLMCVHCGGVFGEPYNGIEIDKGILIVRHYGGSAWRWVESRKFRYQNSGFYLIGSTSDYFWNATDCDGIGVGEAGRKYKDINYITGDEEVIEKTEDCKLIKHTKQKQPKKPLVKLEAFKYEY
ncbi:hypothetical protein PDL71_12035 [Lacibacter sp. MH-610]|uniref:hypothetical protein n=1 Tax=Lacibacter sp. MH-610 TaxID=3020883 RepID=UPI003892873C